MAATFRATDPLALQPIVDPVTGRATEFFMRQWVSQKKVNQANSLFVPQSRKILTGAGLTGGGDLTADRTISLNLPNTGPGVGTYGDATHVPQITLDAAGRITAASNVAITGSGGGLTSLVGRTVTPVGVAASTAQQSLFTQTVPAGALATDGQSLILNSVWRITAAGTGTYAIAIHWGGLSGTLVLGLSFTGRSLTMYSTARIFRTGATAQALSGYSLVFNSVTAAAALVAADSLMGPPALTAALTLANPNDVTFDVTPGSATLNQIFLDYAEVILSG